LTLSGRTYRQAVELARRSGVALGRGVITAPPQAAAGRGELRVIAERVEEGRLTLILAYEHYRRQARPA